ncbi:MAG: indole-3-glycerol phosphate synthase TrpC [Solirubrobacteraceae bacterium]
MNELERIVARTRGDVEGRRAAVPLSELQSAAQERAASDPPRPFAAALARVGGRVSVIAEHKRRSPSAGTIREDLRLEDVVTAYERGGAAALSVLTEQVGFGGTLDDLRRTRAIVKLPILRKDFVVDPYQVVESMAAGADAILLIVAALDAQRLGRLQAQALALGLGVLVEVHDRAELEIAAGIGAAVIGINNRDLATLQVDTSRTLELLADVPAGVTVVSESGLRTRADLEQVAQAGVDAALVGEALMRSPDVERACRELTGVVV